MSLTRRGILAVAMALTASAALAHHGWRWTDGDQFELTGTIVHADLGNPHGVLSIDAGEEVWAAEVGQPWRNDRAGLTDEMMSVGREITVIGERATDPEQLRMKAEVVVVDGTRHVLYPDRA